MGFWHWGCGGGTAWDDGADGWTKGPKCHLKGGGCCLGFEEAGSDSWAYSKVKDTGRVCNYITVGYRMCQGACDVMIRGSANTFNPGDATPGWSVYEGPRNYPWRYIQVKLQHAELAFMGRYGHEFMDRTGHEFEDR